MTNALPLERLPEELRLPAGSIDVGELRAGEEDQWDQYVLASSSATFFHLRGWKQVIEKVLRRQCFFLAARRGSKITGVFPISRVKSLVFGDCLVSLPLAVYGGICADDESSYAGL